MPKKNGTPLKLAREGAGLSVVELSKKLGVHEKNYYRIERGEQVPKRELARRIHKFFKGDLTYAQIVDPEYAAKL